MKRVILALILVVSMIGNLSCSQDKDGGTISEETIDLSSSQLKMKLTDKVEIDATVTPQERYKDGLNTYYLEPHVDNGGKKYTKENSSLDVMCGHEIEESLQAIEENTKGTFNRKKMTFESDVMDVVLKVPYRDGADQKELSCFYARVENQQLHGLEIYFERPDAGRGFYICGGEEMKEHSSYREQDFDFMTRQEAGDTCRKMMETITGKKIAQEMFVVPVDKTLYEEATYELSDIQPFEEEYYVVTMYYDVDGFPWKGLQAPMKIPQGKKLDDAVAKADDEWLLTLDEWLTRVAIGKDGIIDFGSDCIWETGDVYKDHEKVCDLREIIKNIKTYYETIVLKDTVHIYDISIAYGSYFTDGSDGVVKNAVWPFWVATLKDDEGKEERLIYDAYTGEFIENSWVLT